MRFHHFQNIHNKIGRYSKIDGSQESIDRYQYLQHLLIKYNQESFRTLELNQGPEQAAFQREAQYFFEQSQSIQHPVFDHTIHLPFGSCSFEDDWHQQFQRVKISSPLQSSQYSSSNQLGKQVELNGIPS